MAGPARPARHRQASRGPEWLVPCGWPGTPPLASEERLTAGWQGARVPGAGRGATWTPGRRAGNTPAQCASTWIAQRAAAREPSHGGLRLRLPGQKGRRWRAAGRLWRPSPAGPSVRPAGAPAAPGPPKAGVTLRRDAPPDLAGAGRSDSLRDLWPDLQSRRTPSPAGAPRGTREGQREHRGPGEGRRGPGVGQGAGTAVRPRRNGAVGAAPRQPRDGRGRALPSPPSALRSHGRR